MHSAATRLNNSLPLEVVSLETHQHHNLRLEEAYSGVQIHSNSLRLGEVLLDQQRSNNPLHKQALRRCLETRTLRTSRRVRRRYLGAPINSRVVHRCSETQTRGISRLEGRHYSGIRGRRIRRVELHCLETRIQRTNSRVALLRCLATQDRTPGRRVYLEIRTSNSHLRYSVRLPHNLASRQVPLGQTRYLESPGMGTLRFLSFCIYLP